MPRRSRYSPASPIVGSTADGDSCGCAAKSNGQLAGRYTSPVKERLTYVPPSAYQPLSTATRGRSPDRSQEREVTLTRTVSPSRNARSASPVTYTRSVTSPRGTLELSKTYEIPQVSNPGRRETSSVPRVLSPRAGLLQTRSMDRQYLKDKASEWARDKASSEHVHGDHQHHLHHIEHKLQKLAVSDFTKDYPNLPAGKVVDVTNMDRDGNGTVIRDVDDLDADTVHIPRLPKVVSASPEGVEHIEDLLLRPKEVTATAIADWSKSQASSRASSRASSVVSTRSSSLASTPSRYTPRSSSPSRGYVPSSQSMTYTPSTPTRYTPTSAPAARAASPRRSASPPRYVPTSAPSAYRAASPGRSASPLRYTPTSAPSAYRAASPVRVSSPVRYVPASGSVPQVSVPRSATQVSYTPSYSAATRTGRSSSPERYSPTDAYSAAVPSRSISQYRNTVANALGSEL
jgi:hypothetical protein